jgi:hypothetical protein
MKIDWDEVLHWLMMTAAVCFFISFTLLWISLVLTFLNG